MTEYNIWKVEASYSGTRYYESAKQFERHGLSRLGSKLWKHRAYRFTSEGWIEIKIVG